MKQNLYLVVFLLVVSAFMPLKEIKQKTPPQTKKSNCLEVPQLNKKIIEYIKGNLGKKIGRGECWDVASAALNSVGAKWDKKFNFGKVVDPKIECIYPGDIIQLKDALIEAGVSKGTHIYDEYPQHTAVIFEVLNKNELVLADQNFGYKKDHLNTHPIFLNKIVRGSFVIYRPTK